MNVKTIQLSMMTCPIPITILSLLFISRLLLADAVKACHLSYRQDGISEL